MKTFKCYRNMWGSRPTYAIRGSLNLGMMFKLKGIPELDGTYAVDTQLVSSAQCDSGCPFSVNGSFVCKLGRTDLDHTEPLCICSEDNKLRFRIRSIDQIMEGL